MSVQIQFEIHTLKKERWLISMIGQDRDDTLRQAEDIFRTEKIDAIKVVEDVYNQGSGESKQRVIFSAKRGDKVDTLTYAKSVRKNLERIKANSSERRNGKSRAFANSGSGPRKFGEQDRENEGDADRAVLIFGYIVLIVLGLWFGFNWMANKGLIETFW